MDAEKKIELAGRLAEYPLLRVLLYEKWFRVIFALFLLVLFGGLLALPKIWKTSPKDFRPVVKVSLLDLAQTWSLKRTARKAVAQGDRTEAIYAWQMAWANNRADSEAVRGLLQTVLQHERGAKQVRSAASPALWLLRLTGTNATDLELTAEVLDRSGFSDYLAGLLEMKKDSLTPRLEAIYLKALFDTGNYRAFASRWDQTHEKVATDAEIQLYRAGYLATWGPPTESAGAIRELERAADDPDKRALACRLRLLVSVKRSDLAEYEKYLKRLEEWRADTLMQHLGYWRMLLGAGKSAQAIELARSYPHPPDSAGELIELARLFVQAGNREHALGLFKRYGQEFGYAPNVWVAYAQELEDDRQWTALRDLAAQIRSVDAVADSLAGFSYFIEGRAETALERETQAKAAFTKMLDRGFEFPHLALRAATDLYSMRQLDVARSLLLKMENDFLKDANFWILFFSVANALKEPDLMLKAARQAHVLQPNHAVIMNNYAAALLIQRQNPEEAARLTLQLFTQNPNALATRVNHAASLLLNGRAEEAEKLLNTVRTNALTSEQMAMFQLDQFEIHYRLGRFDQARVIGERVAEELLYPAQREWLRKTRVELAQMETKEPRK